MKKKKEREIEKMNASRPVYFNHRCFEIQQKEIRDEIFRNIRKIGHYNVTSKYYSFLNKRNLSEIKDGDFRISLSSYGKKFLLFLTSYQDKKKSIFINKKNEVMMDTSFKFIGDLYLGTLLDGELVKNDENKWIFIINDIPYYKGENMITKSFEERQNMIHHLLNHEKMVSDTTDTTYVSKKIYFEYRNLQDMCKRFRESLNYKTSGVWFRNIFNYGDNYLYVFPECRTDHQILNPVVVAEEKMIESKQVEEESKDDIFGDVDVVETVINKSSVDEVENKNCKFMIRPTVKPDLYELYCRSVDKHIEKYSYAGIPNMETSRLLKEWVKDVSVEEDITTLIREKKAIYVECKYHKIFKKWIPIRKCEDMDHHTQINKIQILLDTQKNESDSEEDD
jgi:hypothetical protein